jgi:hypothetical protein
MKKLLLIPLLFLITPDAKADMDKICYPSFPEDGTSFDRISKSQNDDDKLEQFIAERCERNNIVFFNFVYDINRADLIADWCRHDREINYFLDTIGSSKRYELVCVLYDNKPRKFLRGN